MPKLKRTKTRRRNTSKAKTRKTVATPPVAPPASELYFFNIESPKLRVRPRLAGAWVGARSSLREPSKELIGKGRSVTTRAPGARGTKIVLMLRLGALHNACAGEIELAAVIRCQCYAAALRSSHSGEMFPSIVVWNATKFAFAGEGNLPLCSAFEKGERAASRLSGEQAYLMLGSASPGLRNAAR